MGMENETKSTEEKPTAYGQHETGHIKVGTEEYSAENEQKVPKQNATSNDTLLLNSTSVVDPGKPSSNKSPGAPKGPSESARVETLPSDLNRCLKELKDIQAKELREFNEPFFAMMRNAGDPSERASESINTMEHKQSRDIGKAKASSGDRSSKPN
jgi:hypothetical protein